MMQRALTQETESAAPPADRFSSVILPPFDLDIEQALLGALLVRNDALDQVIDFLEPLHFFDPLHRQIYGICVSLIAGGKVANPLTLRGYFQNAEPISADLTVAQYLGTLAVNAATTINARTYGTVIRDLAIRRELIVIGQDIAAAASEAHVEFTPNEQIEEAESRLFALVEHRERGQETDFASAVAAAVQSAKDAHTGKKIGLATKLVDLDDKLGGLHPTDLIILAGRPGMGKSSLAANIARNIAQEAVDKDGVVTRGTPVAFFSLEMSREQIAMRLLGECLEIASDRMRKGKLSDEEMRKIKDNATGVAEMPIHVDDTGALSIAQLSARARRLKRKHSIGLIIVDYLQYMQGSKRSENRVQDITAITAGLKALAKELRVPVLALSQLNRSVEGRDNKRPQLADLRESGSIEQDADAVLFVFREEYYVQRDKPAISDTEKYADWNAKLMEVKGKAEIIIAKQRHGATGMIDVAFSDELMRFSNLAQQGVNHG